MSQNLRAIKADQCRESRFLGSRGKRAKGRRIAAEEAEVKAA